MIKEIYCTKFESQLTRQMVIEEGEPRFTIPRTPVCPIDRVEWTNSNGRTIILENSFPYHMVYPTHDMKYLLCIPYKENNYIDIYDSDGRLIKYIEAPSPIAPDYQKNLDFYNKGEPMEYIYFNYIEWQRRKKSSLDTGELVTTVSIAYDLKDSHKTKGSIYGFISMTKNRFAYGVCNEFRILNLKTFEFEELISYHSDV